MSSVPSVTLNQSVSIPQIGFGVWQMDNTDVVRFVKLAFDAGYSRVYTSTPNFAKADGRVLPRFVIRSGTPANAVSALRSGRIPKAFLGDLLKWGLRRSLGNRLYEDICHCVRPSTLPP